MSDEKSPMIGACSLWKNVSKDGTVEYLSGYMGDIQVNIWKNKYKTESKHPDYRMTFSQRQRKPAAEAEEFLKTPMAPLPQATPPAPEPQPAPNDNDIPF